MSSQNNLFALMDAASLLPPMVAPSRASPASATVVSDDDDLAKRSAATSPDLNSPSSSSTSSSSPFDETVPVASRKKSRALPLILMSLLLSEEDPTQPDNVLSFSDDGASFVILRPHAFAAGPMRTVFRCVKFPTFVKKLERWGFRQVQAAGGASKKESLVFAHPLFRRGDWDACRMIRAVKNLGRKRARSSSSASSLSSGSEQSSSYSSPSPPLSAPSTRPTSPTPAAADDGAFHHHRAGPPPFPSSSAFEGRVEAMTRYLREDSASAFLPSLSQAEVDRTTRSVVGAAVEALERDSDMKAARARSVQRRLRELQAARLATAAAAMSSFPSSVSMPQFPPPMAMMYGTADGFGALGVIGGGVASIDQVRMEVANATAATRLELELLRRRGSM